MHRRQTALAAVALSALSVVPPQRAVAAPPAHPIATGYGGAISTVDATATAVGLDVLRRGGNAVDAAVAAAATLGVTEPFSAGIGGGGFLVHYDAATGRVETVDGREAAPAAATTTLFVDPVTGRPYAFDEARISGLSVGVPGTLQTWRAPPPPGGPPAPRRGGGAARAGGGAGPGAGLRRRGAGGAARGSRADPPFRPRGPPTPPASPHSPAPAALSLRGGAPPAIGSTLHNP